MGQITVCNQYGKCRWYIAPWDFVAIYPDVTVREKYAVAMENGEDLSDLIQVENLSMEEFEKNGFIILEDMDSLSEGSYAVRGAIYVGTDGESWCISLDNGYYYRRAIHRAGLSTLPIDICPTYQVGNTYHLTMDKVRVYLGASKSYHKKSFSQLTASERRNAYADGRLRKGAKVECRGLSECNGCIWMKIPSGWIPAYYGGSIYVN